jgi:hypothetical protein
MSRQGRTLSRNDFLQLDEVVSYITLKDEARRPHASSYAGRRAFSKSALPWAADKKAPAFAEALVGKK